MSLASLPGSPDGLAFETAQLREQLAQLQMKLNSTEVRLQEATSLLAEPPLELDSEARGKLTRRLWLSDQRILALQAEVQESRDKQHLEVASIKEEIEFERAVSAGLRGRIGQLEKRIRDEREDFEKRMATERHARLVVEEQLNQLRDETKDLKKRLEDTSLMLSKERIEMKKLKEDDLVMKEMLAEANKALQRAKDEKTLRRSV